MYYQPRAFIRMNNLAISSWEGVLIIKTKLIILRGNSGSGKTTIAKRLQNYFGEGTLLVSQDTVRRDMLMVRDREGNISQDLIRQISEYGKGKCKFVIIRRNLSLHIKTYMKLSGYKGREEANQSTSSLLFVYKIEISRTLSTKKNLF
jgi:alpha-D-ribose 1-methylphosphonate 5-triphosphate synthase subunit PhnL